MHKYDAAIVGAGLGGLAAAAVLSRNNKRVVVIDPDKTAGGSASAFERGGFSFSAVPSLSFGFERGGVFQEMYAKHGIGYGASVLSPCYQVLLPDMRVNVYDNNEGTLDELQREFSGEIDAISGLYRELRKLWDKMEKSWIATYQAKRTPAGRFLKRRRLSNEFRLFLDVQSVFFFLRSIERVTLYTLALMINNAPHTLNGGFSTLAKRMLDAVLQNGGEVVFSEPWPGLSGGRRKAAGLATSKGLMEADVILFNTQQERGDEALFLAVRNEVVPVGMGRELLILPDYEKTKMRIYLSVSGPDDKKPAPEGTRAMAALSAGLESYRDKDETLRRIKTVMPFLDDNLLFYHEHRPEKRLYRFPTGTKFRPLNPGDDASSMSRTSLKNVYLMNDDTGTPAQRVRSGLRMAETLLKKL